MSHRNKYDWSALFQEFSDTGLSQVRFCAERGVHAKYFGLRYAKHQRTLQSSFTRAEVAETKQQRGPVVFRLRHGELRFDSPL